LSRGKHLCEDIGVPFAAHPASPIEANRECSRKRILLAGLYHGTNAFLGGRTTLVDFEIRRGDEILRAEGGAFPLTGVLGVARDRNWEVLPVVDLRAMPGARVTDAVVDLFWAEFRAIADAEAAHDIDGVFLVLHGAMVSESLLDVEGEILRRIRGIEHLSDAPICGVMDPYANFTDAMARQSDGLIAYRENPSTDAGDAAFLASLLLDGLMQTEDRPATVWDHPPVMWPPGGAATDSDPMLTLERRAREIETEMPDILAVNIMAGFPFADVPKAGVSFSAVTTGDLELARGALRELNVIASSMREVGDPPGMALEEAMVLLEQHREGPVLLVEPSDNVSAGGPGDDTRVLRALVEHGIRDAGVVINDPETVSILEGVHTGDHHEVVIGGKSGETGVEPLPLRVEVVSKSDGCFVPEDDKSRLSCLFSQRVDMGPCAIVRHEGVTVLLTSRRTPPFDLAQWRSQGINPEKLFVIGVKAAIEHRPAYEAIAKASYTVDLPGPCTENLELLPFERVGRPAYPLDDL
jgi:microcystin degradation protein MlrC